MNQSSDEDDSNSKNLSKEKNTASETISSPATKPTSANQSPPAPSASSSKLVVRKLSEARKMPFQQNLRDESQACSSRDGKSWFNHDLINPFVID